MMLAAVLVTASVLAASAVRGWVVSTVPLKVDEGGQSRLIDTHHHYSPPLSAAPECNIIAVIFTPNEGAPFPQGNELYMVVLSDPDHDNEVVGEGCVTHPNGACVDEVFDMRVNYRHLYSNEGHSLGYNWCVPKGWQTECDYQPLDDTCRDVNPGTYDCTRCDGANECDTNAYGRWCQTWDPSKSQGTDASGSDKRTGENPSGSQGDCHFSYEIAVFNKRPRACRIEPFRVHAFHPDQLVHQADEIHYTVVVEGDDAEVGANEKVEFWIRSFPDNCLRYKQWFDATPANQRTVVTQQCGHPSNGDKYYHGMSTTFPDDGKDFDTALGVGQHCAGHSQPDKCSPKHFSDEMFPFGRCRIYGCSALPGATGADKCQYGDLIASTNFEFSMTVEETAASACAPADESSHRFYEVLFHGTSTAMGNPGTASTIDDNADPALSQEPNFCCNIDGIHFENPNGHHLFTGAPVPPGSLQNIPCGIGPDGRQMVFDQCNVCGGSGGSCQNTNSQAATSLAPRAVTATAALATAVVALALALLV